MSFVPIVILDRKKICAILFSGSFIIGSGMDRIKKRFTPLGFDYIALACWNREFWGKRLERFGFKKEKKEENGDDLFGKNDYDAYWGSAFSLGRVRVFLVDPATVRWGKTYVEWFLKTRGNMQVIEVGVSVDSADEAFQEFRERGMSLIYPVARSGDVFGKYRATEIIQPLEWSFRWRIVERENREALMADHALFMSEGIDHIAIAVRNLHFWTEIYKSLGFKVVYTPQGEEGLIEGKESAMKTYALQRGGWIVALVEGVDKAQASQVTTYVETHGDHSVQHAAFLFPDVRFAARTLLARGAQFRFSKPPQMQAISAIEKVRESVTTDHILHQGEDYSGPLLQCFTKPFDRKWLDKTNPRSTKGKGGFFFELVQRLPKAAKKRKNKNKQQFHTPTVRGLFESIEREDIKEDDELMFPREKQNS